MVQALILGGFTIDINVLSDRRKIKAAAQILCMSNFRVPCLLAQGAEMMESSHCILKPAPGLRSPLSIDRSSEGLMLLVSDQKILTKFETGNVASKKKF
jgi:hypothetical protein